MVTSAGSLPGGWRVTSTFEPFATTSRLGCAPTKLYRPCSHRFCLLARRSQGHYTDVTILALGESHSESYVHAIASLTSCYASSIRWNEVHVQQRA